MAAKTPPGNSSFVKSRAFQDARERMPLVNPYPYLEPPSRPNPYEGWTSEQLAHYARQLNAAAQAKATVPHISERQREAYRNNPRGPRAAPHVTRDDLLLFKDAYEGTHDHIRGWMVEAGKHFGMSADTVARRVKT